MRIWDYVLRILTFNVNNITENQFHRNYRHKLFYITTLILLSEQFLGNVYVYQKQL